MVPDALLRIRIDISYESLTFCFRCALLEDRCSFENENEFQWRMNEANFVDDIVLPHIFPCFDFLFRSIFSYFVGLHRLDRRRSKQKLLKLFNILPVVEHEEERQTPHRTNEKKNVEVKK